LDVARELVKVTGSGIAATIVVNGTDCGLTPRADGPRAGDLEGLNAGIVVVERAARV